MEHMLSLVTQGSAIETIAITNEPDAIIRGRAEADYDQLPSLLEILGGVRVPVTWIATRSMHSLAALSPWIEVGSTMGRAVKWNERDANGPHRMVVRVMGDHAVVVLLVFDEIEMRRFRALTQEVIARSGGVLRSTFNALPLIDSIGRVGMIPAGGALYSTLGMAMHVSCSAHAVSTS